VGLALGGGQFITVDGKVVKLGIQEFGPGNAQYIVKVNNVVHVVVPQPLTEDVSEGMAIEDLVWSLVGLLLDRGAIESGKLASLEVEVKENL